MLFHYLGSFILKFMIKYLTTLILLTSLNVNAQVNSLLLASSREVHYNDEGKATLIELKQNLVPEKGALSFLYKEVLPGENWGLKETGKSLDRQGYSHTRYQLLYNNTEFYGKTIITHCRSGFLESVNGDLQVEASPKNNFALNETQALSAVLKHVNASRYKWENKAEEELMGRLLNNPAFSYQPKGSRVLISTKNEDRYAYVFTIYAEEPLYRGRLVVDAQNGAILSEVNLLCSVDVPGTAQTKFSGTQSITCDQSGSVYSLRETQRGQGIETYNLNYTSNYGSATNFTNASASWTGTGADQGARDAHWGAEKTYDYYFNMHNRNSIDSNGMKLLSYVHYNTNYANAFWDGARMTYGDGNGTSTYIFTTLDICGHEITHGLTEHTADLIYQGESGALNESYSDIFGTLIENYGRPGNWNWKVGEDMTASGNGIRNMQNPNQFADPDTYGGLNWFTGTGDNGGVHTNSGVNNFWFYLLSMGGSGTNDLSQSYSVSALGLNQAAQIAFRALTQKFTQTTNYSVARILTIQAAKELFGPCSNQVIQTTNAWHAVGIGPAYVPGQIGADFTAIKTNYCTLPATVNFNNTTVNGITYTWDFGDGSALLTTTTAIHTYTQNGSFNVKLKATGCNNGLDSITKTAYIVVFSPAPPVANGTTVCENSSALLTASGNNQISWYAGSNSSVPIATGNSFSTPNLSSTATYYVANTLSNSPMFGGIPTNVGGGFLNNAAQWLNFNVGSNCTLNSVQVYAQNAGNRIIEMRNASNQVVYSHTAALTAGANTVNLNFYLTPGANYQLGLANGSTSGLYRSNNGVNYPYNLGGVVTIIGSSAGNAYYYWFYNWKVTESDCMSPLVAVTATVLPRPQVTISSNATVVCMNDEVQLSGTPSGGTFAGNGVSGSTFVPPTSTGQYLVSYTYSDPNGCGNSDSLILEISECLSLKESKASTGISIYPNPVSEQLWIQCENVDEKVLELYDSAGRLVIKETLKTKLSYIDISELSKGFYLLSIRDGNGLHPGTFKLLKD